MWRCNPKSPKTTKNRQKTPKMANHTNMRPSGDSLKLVSLVYWRARQFLALRSLLGPLHYLRKSPMAFAGLRGCSPYSQVEFPPKRCALLSIVWRIASSTPEIISWSELLGVCVVSEGRKFSHYWLTRWRWRPILSKESPLSLLLLRSRSNLRANYGQNPLWHADPLQCHL